VETKDTLKIKRKFHNKQSHLPDRHTNGMTDEIQLKQHCECFFRFVTGIAPIPS